MDTYMNQKFIICDNCGAINKKENAVCIKCSADIGSHFGESDYSNPDFMNMNYNIPGNYLTEAGKETTENTDFIDEPEQDDEEEIFVFEPDEFGLNGVIPKRTVSYVNNHNSTSSPSENHITLKNPFVIIGLVVLLLIISIATIMIDTNSEIAEVVSNEISPVTNSAALSDNSVEKFYQAYCSLDNGEEISLKNSRTYAFVQDIKKKNACYISLTDIDEYDKSESTAQIAIKGKDVAILNDWEDYSSYMYIVDMKYTMYDPSTRTAQSMTLSENTYNSMVLRSYIFEKINFDISDDTDEDYYSIKSYTTEIDGNIYTYETIKESYENSFECLHYYVYDDKGKLCICGDEYGSLTIIEKITDNVPPGVFNQPLGYNITDLDDIHE